MSELRDRLEALATRGTRRGADDVLNAARRDAQSAGDRTADADSAEMTIADDDLPLVTLETGPRRRRRLGSFVASAGIAALVGVGALAITAMFGSGGAGSPEGAVRQLADAITHKDPLAAVDVLVPSEVRSMRETVKGATQRAADLRIVNEASQPLAGVDLSVDNLQLATESLGDGYAKVIITSGELSSGAHRSQLSGLIQKAMRNSESDPTANVDLAKLAADSDLPTFVVAVRRDGGWYVSPAYTTLEYIREINHYPAADFGSAKTAAVGADTPELAVSDALRAWQANDWNRLLALSPPDELPVYDYRAMIQESVADGSNFTIDHLSTTAEISGDNATVKLDASGTYGSDPTEKWQVGGTCAAGSLGYVADAGNPENPPGLCLSGDLGRVPLRRFVFGSTGSSSTGPVSISVVRENGRWFVSPVTTALGILDSTIQHIDERTVYTLLGLSYELPPDGTITLDQPFQVAAPTQDVAPRVYAFDGQAGQEVVGAINSPESSGPPDGPYISISGEIYTVDGDDIGYVEFGSYPNTVKLPISGSYRLVLESWGIPRDGATLTLWDLAHAPKSVRDNASRSSETCTSSGDFSLGGQSKSCSASATPTTYPYPDSSSGSFAPSPVVTATSTVGPTTTVP